jgi:hypothetical protein
LTRLARLGDFISGAGAMTLVFAIAYFHWWLVAAGMLLMAIPIAILVVLIRKGRMQVNKSSFSDSTSGMGAMALVLTVADFHWWLVAAGMLLMATAIGLVVVEHRRARSGKST